MSFERLREQQPGLAGEIDTLLNSGYAGGGVPMYYVPPPSHPTEPQITDGGNVPWRRRNWQRYGVDGDVQAGSTMYRDRPMHTATTENNVQVPLLQALITGLFVSFAVIAVFVSAGWTSSIKNLAAIGIAVLAVVTCIAWLKFRESHYALLWLHEELVGHDLNGDGVVGQPSQIEQQKPEKEIVLIRAHPGNDIIFSTMHDGTEVPQDQLIAFVTDGYKSGYTLDLARRCGLERPQWDSVIDTMEKLALVSPKSQGIDARALPGIVCRNIVNKIMEL